LSVKKGEDRDESRIYNVAQVWNVLFGVCRKINIRYLVPETAAIHATYNAPEYRVRQELLVVPYDFAMSAVCVNDFAFFDEKEGERQCNSVCSSLDEHGASQTNA